jgi:DNA gyrase/topoisomerase IV subunit A
MPGSEAGSGPQDPKVAAIAAGAAFAITKNGARGHLLSAVIKAAEQSERVRALVAASESESAAEAMLASELDLDPVQARTVLDMQFRSLTAARRQKMADEQDALLAACARYEAIAASPGLQEALVGTDEGKALLRLAAIDAEGQPL